jgi:hypothetical protein
MFTPSRTNVGAFFGAFLQKAPNFAPVLEKKAPTCL